MSHVTSKQRYTIEVMLNQGYRQIDISKAIGKCKSVVSREIRRNCDNRNGAYRCALADRKASERHRKKPKFIRFTTKVRKYVEQQLNIDWSPEQISNTECDLDLVSPERIYQHIIEDQKRGGQLYTHKRRKKKYRSRLKSPDRRGKIKMQLALRIVQP